MNYKVSYAINVTEPIVKRTLERKGYIIINSTINEDYDGIDFTVVNRKTGVKTRIDVKCSEERNWQSPNFLFTIKTQYGKHYKDKNTDYVAFIDFPKQEIVIIGINELSSLVDIAKQRTGNGIYVLLNKDNVRALGYSIHIMK